MEDAMSKSTATFGEVQEFTLMTYKTIRPLAEKTGCVLNSVKLTSFVSQTAV